ncbi:MAG: beta-lactamase family protein [Bacteroidales bacterium]|nr:beta-lactamase family protein [Bacteroidales bacterium]
MKTNVYLLFVLFSCWVTSCRTEPEISLGNVNVEKLHPGMAQAHIIEEMNNVLDSGYYGPLRSLAILKDNKLVHEQYGNGYNNESLIPWYQVTKTITAMLIGIAIDNRYIESVDNTLVQYFPEYSEIYANDSLKKLLTLHHMMSSSSGLRRDNEWIDRENIFEFILSYPMDRAPGLNFYHHRALDFTLGEIILRATGKSIDEFADEHLFKPMDILNWKWDKDAYGRVRSEGQDLGLWLTTRDMAKIATLIQNNGNWNGKQLISASWIKEMQKPWMKSNDYFGYLCRIKSEGYAVDLLHQSKVTCTFGRSNCVWVSPSLNVVIVLAMEQVNNNQRILHEIPNRYIMPALFPGKTIERISTDMYQVQPLEVIVDGDPIEWKDLQAMKINKTGSLPNTTFKCNTKIAYSPTNNGKFFIAMDIQDDDIFVRPLFDYGNGLGDYFMIQMDFTNTGRIYTAYFNINGQEYQGWINENNFQWSALRGNNRIFIEMAFEPPAGVPNFYDLVGFNSQTTAPIGFNIVFWDYVPPGRAVTTNNWSYNNFISSSNILHRKGRSDLLGTLVFN